MIEPLNAVAYGKIVKCNGHSNTYTVVLYGEERAQVSDVPFVGTNSSSIVGPKSLKVLEPGDTVLVDTSSGIMDYRIISQVESLQDLPTSVVPSSIVPDDMGIGSSQDPLVNIAEKGSGRITNADSNSYGGYSAGSVGALGTAYGHTLLRAFLRASDVCGVEACVLGHLLRVKGFNYQFWSSMGEQEISSTGDTITNSTQETYFAHEALGRNTKKEQFAVNSLLEDKTLLDKDEPVEAYKVEVDKAEGEGKDVHARREVDRIHQKYEQIQQDHPQILPRKVVLNGYLGHGSTDIVVKAGSAAKGVVPLEATGIPNLTLDGGEEESTYDSSDYLNVVHKGRQSTPILTGLSEIQRAADGRVRITSAKSIGLVKELSIPVPHKVKCDPKTEPDHFKVDPLKDYKCTNVQESARSSARKELAYRKHDRQFVEAHPEWDYEHDTGDLLSRSQGGSDYDPDKLTGHVYKVPPSTNMKVDDDSNVKFYKSRAGIFLTDDGGIVLQDGYGSSITMTGGNIYMNCPGDIWEFPGRDKNTWAGRSINNKAQEDVEIVSSLGNTRIKSEKQMSILGGAGKSVGGVLIQSLGEKVEEKYGGDSSSGGIVIKSETHIGMQSAVTGVTTDKLGVKGLNGETHVSVDGTTSTLKLTTEDLQAQTGAFNGTAMIATAAMTGGSPSFSPSDTGPVIPSMAALTGGVAGKKGFLASEFNFSFKTSDEYGYPSTYNLEIMESLWQTRDRLKGVSVKHWSEKALPITAEYSKPHPGKAMWDANIYRRPVLSDGFTLNPDKNYVTEFENKVLAESFIKT